MKLKILILIILLFFGNCINANEMTYNDKYVYIVSQAVTGENNYNDKKNFSSPVASVQEKVFFDDKDKLKNYIKNQAKKLEKSWQKEALPSKSRYKLSYARVMFFVDDKGNIQSYKIKSSCVPSGDTEFIAVVNNYIKTLNFDSLPKDFKNKVIVFTVKFNSFIPSDYTKKRVTSDRYGIADIEVAKNRTYFVMSSKKPYYSDKEWK